MLYSVIPNNNLLVLLLNFRDAAVEARLLADE